MSIFSEFTAGENPYHPSLANSSILDKLLIPNDLSKDNKDICYHLYLDDES